MRTIKTISAALDRLISGQPEANDWAVLLEARDSRQISVVTGERAVQFGGSADGAVVVTGDGSIVLQLGASDAAVVDAIFDRLFPSRVFQLPADLRDFTGRDDVVAQLRKLLANSGGTAVAAITGMGGLGKTELAVHVAHLVAPHYPEGQLLVRLRGTRATPLTTVEAMTSIIHSFEPLAQLPNTVEALQSIYNDVLANRRVLLILDDALDDAQIVPLMEPASCGVIVTSRRTVAPDGFVAIDLDVMAEDEAIALLGSITGANRASAGELSRIANLCGYLPLALRIAGTFLKRNRTWSVAEYIEALSNERQRLEHLVLDGRTDRDVAASLNLSVRQLQQDHAELESNWRMLSVFPSSFDRLAVATVWNVELEAARDGLQRLLDRSLVLYDGHAERFRLHDLMRALAADTTLLSNQDDAPELIKQLEIANAKHAEYFLKDAVIQFAELEYELPNLLKAVDWAYETKNWATLSESVLALDKRLERNGYWSSRPALIRIGVAVAETSKNFTPLVRLRNRLAILAMHQGDFSIADENFGRNYQLANDLDRLDWKGTALHSLGRAAEAAGNYGKAENFYQQSLEIAKEKNDTLSTGPTLFELGVVAFRVRNIKKAENLYRQALDIVKKAGDRNIEAAALHALGLLASNKNRFEESEALYLASLKLKRKLNDREELGRTLLESGKLYKKQGVFQDSKEKLIKARADLEEAAEIFLPMRHKYSDQTKDHLSETIRLLSKYENS